jgi:hypothetical protein
LGLTGDHGFACAYCELKPLIGKTVLLQIELSMPANPHFFYYACKMLIFQRSSAAQPGTCSLLFELADETRVHADLAAGLAAPGR